MTGADPSEPQPGRAARWAWALPAALVLAVAGLYFSETRAYGLMGFDSYPLILTARVQGWADLWGTFGEEMMDGRYAGQYHRPLLNAVFAIDFALWGLEARGYQLTNALLFAGAAMALWALARRILGPRSAVASIAALLFFLLHESHFEVLPVPARRPELLCGMFACLALWTQLDPRRLEKRWPLLPAALMACAAASKETGYVLPAVACLGVLLWSPRSGLGTKLGQAARAGLCHAAFLAPLFALRLFALGGIGGPAPLPVGFEGPGAFELSWTLLRRLGIPQSVEGLELVALLAGIWLPLIVALLVVFSWRDARSGSAKKDAADSRRAVALAFAWIGLVALLYGLSRSIEQWYLFLPIVGVSLLFGAGLELLASFFRRGTTIARSLSMLGLAPFAAFAFVQLRYSPAFHDYPEWRTACAASEEFLAELERRIEATPAGEPLRAPPLPMWIPAPDQGPAVRGAAILDVYSVQAWAELRFPERKLRVIDRPPGRSPEPGESLIQVLRPKRF